VAGSSEAAAARRLELLKSMWKKPRSADESTLYEAYRGVVREMTPPLTSTRSVVVVSELPSVAASNRGSYTIVREIRDQRSRVESGCVVVRVEGGDSNPGWYGW